MKIIAFVGVQRAEPQIAQEDRMSDRDDLQPDGKEKPSNFMIIDEAAEKPKTKGKPKRYYLPDHLVVNTKLMIGVILVGALGFAISELDISGHPDPRNRWHSGQHARHDSFRPF
jgi:hypothetical protein